MEIQQALEERYGLTFATPLNVGLSPSKENLVFTEIQFSMLQVNYISPAGRNTVTIKRCDNQVLDNLSSFMDREVPVNIENLWIFLNPVA